jgi:hypothetical protein
LAKQAGAQIPRGLGVAVTPAPACVEPVEDPDRLADRAGQMRRRGVARDHEVEVGDERRRVGEVVQVRGQVDDLGTGPTARRRLGELGRRRPLLQAVEACLLNLGKTGEDFERQRAAPVDGVGDGLVRPSAASPAKADAKPPLARQARPIARPPPDQPIGTDPRFRRDRRRAPAADS